MTLHNVQCHLDNQGASNLIVELVIKVATMPKIFSEVVEFASALLEGGNQEIQDSFFAKLQSSDVSQGFFKVSQCCLALQLAPGCMVHGFIQRKLTIPAS